LKPLYKPEGFNKVQITQHKVTESEYAPAITDGRTSDLGTTFLKCKLAGVLDYQVLD
jgi:hypothetical protein